ncbi:MAG: demethoxyubiquinone hydroxylase family protein [Pseudomonadota bacterium]|nr:demethoxyubiquinone hydroxylase family protein [Pseudomonadota bacterium]MDE3038893.1 demethoxyubiquinone hydroxylase family protein [Pseudomonadota bacterium]
MRRLPGDTPPEEQVRRMIRVNHAGEYGAARIYAGQLAVLGRSAGASVIKNMAAQEQRHLAAFSAMMVRRQVRPTALMPLWHVAGYALGAATALIGEAAAMACTVAVESVIDRHYAGQEAVLDEGEPELKAAVSQFRAEEREHHDTALAYGAKSSSLYYILTTAIVYQTRFAIWLSTRI